MCLETRRNLTNVFLLCVIKATEPQSVGVMDYTLTHVPARCPRAIRVVGICQGWSNVQKASIFSIPPTTLHFKGFFFFSIKDGSAPS